MGTKTLLILTGPQGSGNHLWSKIFALHPDVYGWHALLHEYWIGHDQEPFAASWEDPDLLKDFDWSRCNYFVTSVSTPYMLNGERTVPNIVRFAATAMGLGIRVKIGIIGRDRNILTYQETRVRGDVTYDLAVKEYERLRTWAPVFLSYELLHLYGDLYLQQLADQLEFPIDYSSPQLANILTDDTNSKYFQPVKHHPTDDLAQHTSRKWR
jgi:hypothetical protein